MSQVARTLLLIVVSICLSHAGLMAQQWDVEVRVFSSDHQNTYIWLHKPQSVAESKVFIRIINTPNNIVRERRMNVPDSAGIFGIWKLALPEGAYRIEIALESSPFWDWESTFFIPSIAHLHASSLVLSSYPINEPSQVAPITEVLSTINNRLYYNLQYHRPKGEKLSVRAILYRQERSAEGETFTSLEQKAEVLDFIKADAHFDGSFDLQNLAPGTYMVELLAYEKDRIIPEIERSKVFTLQWEGLEALFNNPSLALSKMGHIADRNWLSPLREQPKAEQEKALRSFWEARNPNEPYLAMTQYFQRLNTAEELFGNWSEDRAKIFSLFGQAEAESFEQNDEHYERWKYNDLGLTFLFMKKNGTFVQLF